MKIRFQPIKKLDKRFTSEYELRCAVVGILRGVKQAVDMKYQPTRKWFPPHYIVGYEDDRDEKDLHS